VNGWDDCVALETTVVKTLRGGDSGTAAVFSANVDRSSCSCVEGDPCVDGALCLDWKGRYTVAMLARRRKGYFGDNGSN